jgi:hypothetical protein
MDKSGAILGPIGAYFILVRLGETASTFKILFLVALAPAALAVLLLFFIVSPALGRGRSFVVSNAPADLL